MPDGGAPRTVVVLELASTGAGRLAHDDGVIRSTEEALAETTLSLMRDLGIPGTPEVTVKFVTGSAEPNLAVRPFRLTVNGRRCRIPAEDVQRAIGYIRGEAPAPRSHLLGLADVIREPQNREGPSPQRMIRFLRLCCAHAMRRNASALLGSEQLEAYAERLE
jgi:hypothetical protein